MRIILYLYPKVAATIVLSDYGSMILFCKFKNKIWPCEEKPMAPHSSTLAWKVPWMEKPGRLQSMGSLRVRHNWATSLSLFTFMHWKGNGNPLSVLAWRIPGTGEPGGLPSVGPHRVGEYWNGLPFSSPRDLPDPGILPMSPALAGGFFTTEPPGKTCMVSYRVLINIVPSTI